MTNEGELQIFDQEEQLKAGDHVTTGVDIGGGKTRWVLIRYAGSSVIPIARVHWESPNVGDFATRFQDYHQLLRDAGLPVPSEVGIGCPGKVLGQGSYAELTHIKDPGGKNLVLDTAVLQQSLGLEAVILINDMGANILGLNFLDHDDPSQIVRVPKLEDIAPKYPMDRISILAPGSGLGFGRGFKNENGIYVPAASEGGHVSMASGDDMQNSFLSYLRQHVAAGLDPIREHQVSGRGLGYLLDFIVGGRLPSEDVRTQNIRDYKHTGEYQESFLPWYDSLKAMHPNEKAKEIVKKYKKGKYGPMLSAVVGLWTDGLAKISRDEAVDTLPGAIYIAGGTPRRLQDPILRDNRFRHMFQAHATEAHLEMLAGMDIFLAVYSHLGSLGAGWLAAQPDRKSYLK